MYFLCFVLVFFSSRRRHTRCLSDWSSDVCSSDLYVRDRLDHHQSEMELQKQVNQIRVDVQNAAIALTQAHVRYQAAVKSRILEEQTLTAEQKKYQAGASTVYN